MKYTFILIILATLIFSCKKEGSSVSEPAPASKSSGKQIVSFSFTKALNTQLSSDITATISGTQIIAIIPNGTDITQLIPTFTLSEKAKAYIGNNEQVSGQTKNNFSNSLTYKIIAQDNSEASYQVQVQRSGIMPNPNINLTTSYQIFLGTKSYLSLSSITGKTGYSNYLARAYYDFDKDGDEDLMAADLSGTQGPKDIQYYKNNSGTFTESRQSFTTPKGLVHARKLIVQDFNHDGYMDAIIAGHGWDQPPFPGEKPVFLKNNKGTSFTPTDLPLDPGFYHSVCAGDIDNDGDVDLFFTNNFTAGKFLLNDGQGNFNYNAAYYPASLANKNYYTSELYDLNADGYLDLITTGHEQDGAQSIVLWGDNTGKYETTRMTVLPGVTGKGIAIAIVISDINGDGKKDILLNRTGDNPFYKGYYVQVLLNNSTAFTDATATKMDQNANNTAQWVDWYRFLDIDNDGDLDFVADNKQFNLIWKNNGSGVFNKQ